LNTESLPTPLPSILRTRGTVTPQTEPETAGPGGGKQLNSPTGGLTMKNCTAFPTRGGDVSRDKGQGQRGVVVGKMKKHRGDGLDPAEAGPLPSKTAKTQPKIDLRGLRTMKCKTQKKKGPDRGNLSLKSNMAKPLTAQQSCNQGVSLCGSKTKTNKKTWAEAGKRGFRPDLGV